MIWNEVCGSMCKTFAQTMIKYLLLGIIINAIKSHSLSFMKGEQQEYWCHGKIIDCIVGGIMAQLVLGDSKISVQFLVGEIYFYFNLFHFKQIKKKLFGAFSRFSYL